MEVACVTALQRLLVWGQSSGPCRAAGVAPRPLSPRPASALKESAARISRTVVEGVKEDLQGRDGQVQKTKIESAGLG